LKNQRLQTLDFGPFNGGINRSVAKDKLGPNELYDAVGVYLNERGNLSGCYESASNVITFTDAAITATGQKKIPLRSIYWQDDGKIWQLLSQDYAGATSIRRQSTDREYDNYDATAVVYLGYLILCGSGEQTLALHKDFVANRSVTMSAFTYTSATGVVSAVTYTVGSSQSIIVGDIWEVNGSRYAITAVKPGWGGTAFTYTSGTGVVSAITFNSDSAIGHVGVGDVVSLNGTNATVASVNRSGGTFTVQSGLGAIASGNFSSAASFTVASGLGTINSGSATIERYRPIRLGSAYASTGTVTVTAGSRQVTGSGTAFLSDTPAGTYITFSDSGSTNWSKDDIHPRSYKIATVTSNTVLTLEDEFEGTTYSDTPFTGNLSGDAYRVATTALQVNLPFVYKERLFGVGTTASTTNTFYMAGWPGTTSVVSDIYDFMWWDTDATQNTIGLNQGAIIRGVGLEDRCVLFLQNGIHEMRGDPPVDASLGSDLSFSQIAEGTGLSAYDALDVGPDRQSIFFGSPDGMFRLYGNILEPIDEKIRNHELYTTNMQWAAYHDNKVYFTDGTDSYTRATSAFDHDGYRQQFAAIWILDLLSGSWTVTQRLRSDGLIPLHSPHFAGGVHNPYRGDLTNAEVLMVPVPGGFVSLNNRAINYGDDSVIPHSVTIVPPPTSGGNQTIKRVRTVTVIAEPDRSGAPGSLSITAPADKRTGNTSGSTRTPTAITAGDDYRFIANVSGGRGTDRVQLAIGHWSDVVLSTSVTNGSSVADTKSWNSTTDYYVCPLTTNSISRTLERIDILLAVSTSASLAGTLYLLDSSRNSLASAAIYGAKPNAESAEHYSVTTSYAWFTAKLSTAYAISTSTAYYLAIKLSGGAVTIPLVSSTGENTSTLTELGSSLSADKTDKTMMYKLVHSVGDNATLGQLVSISADYLTLPGRKNG
jgi:hypothetical protein